ncbi:MAG: hypothetical protein K2V38_03505, partial [Gemmataceae bacterium]|nr:hypothetical protein [Gemmataceae bacterium]
KLLVDGKPFFFRAVRHTGVPLHVLRQAGFDALWVTADVPADVLEDANREGWLLVPSAPLAPPPGTRDPQTLEAAKTALNNYYRKFSGSDVLFWDLGGARTADQAAAVRRTQEFLRALDRQRPFTADVWYGFRPYSSFLEGVGAHRWPLFTSLELGSYKDWLSQRKDLTSKQAVFWAWVQNHAPDWYLENVAGVRPGDPLAEPVGPHPEQVRLLAYISLACGSRGLGFWSDRFLADSHQGRGRLQGMAILNAELQMLADVLLAPHLADNATQWLPTSHPSVFAALIRGSRGTLLLPIWFGTGCQFVPDQGAVGSVTVKVPLVTDGADPWRISPAGVECLRNSAKKVTGGTELTITEF